MNVRIVVKRRGDPGDCPECNGKGEIEADNSNKTSS